MTGLSDGTIDTPASSAIWKDAELSHFYRIASRRPPKRGSPLIRPSNVSPATVVVDGGHVLRCENDACGHTAIAYNSCRNRHCPKCQGAAARERELEQMVGTGKA
jgi:hypothetical protein